MTKIIVFIALIIVLGAIIYMKYFTSNTPSIMGNNYDAELNNKVSKVEESELQTKIKDLVKESSFRIDNCNELVIQQYNQASQDKPTKEILVNDKNSIKQITDELKNLPEQGDEYIKMSGTVSYTSLTFLCDNNKNYNIEIYGNKLKTPGTGFYSTEHTGEKKVIDLVNQLLNNK